MHDRKFSCMTLCSLDATTAAHYYIQIVRTFSILLFWMQTIFTIQRRALHAIHKWWKKHQRAVSMAYIYYIVCGGRVCVPCMFDLVLFCTLIRTLYMLVQANGENREGWIHAFISNVKNEMVIFTRAHPFWGKGGESNNEQRSAKIGAVVAAVTTEWWIIIK